MPNAGSSPTAPSRSDGDIIVAVGKTADLKHAYGAKETIDGTRFVITPGLINTHVHITGEPLTRGLVPDDLGLEDNVYNWLVPVHMAYTEADERLSCPVGGAGNAAIGYHLFSGGRERSVFSIRWWMA